MISMSVCWVTTVRGKRRRSKRTRKNGTTNTVRGHLSLVTKGRLHGLWDTEIQSVVYRIPTSSPTIRKNYYVHEQKSNLKVQLVSITPKTQMPHALITRDHSQKSFWVRTNIVATQIVCMCNLVFIVIIIMSLNYTYELTLVFHRMSIVI